MTQLLLALLVAAPALINSDKALPATDLKHYSLNKAVTEAPFTLIEFFSPTCPCQEAHDPKLIALAHKYRAQGVQVLLVDSNFSADGARDTAEAQKRGYDFPVVADPDGIWMAALGAKFATDVFVLDRDGKVHYRGGINSESHPVTEKAKPYLDNALGALLAGHEPDPAVTRSMGCALQRW